MTGEYRRLVMSGRCLPRPHSRTATKEPSPVGQQAGRSSAAVPVGLWPGVGRESPGGQRASVLARNYVNLRNTG